MSISKEDSKKSRIAKAAMELFAAKGFEATSVQEIVNRAEVNKAMLFYYFQSKEKLFSYLLRDYFEVFTKEIKEAISPENAPDKNLRNIMDIIVRQRTHQNRFAMEKIAAELKESSSEIAGYIDEELGKFVKVVAGEIRRGIDAMMFREINEELTAMSMIGVMAIFSRVEKKNGPYDDDEIRKFLENFYLEGIRL